MQRISKLAVLAMLGAIAATPVYAENNPITSENGISIPQERLDFQVKVATAKGEPDTPELRKSLYEDLVSLEVMSQEAVRLGLNKNSEVVQQIELSRQSILVSAFVQDYAKSHPISEDQLKQEYEKLKNQHASDKEYNARHILVETEAEAKDIIAQLDKKVKFENLAEKSKDLSSAANGGSLGWAEPSIYDPVFADAMVSLEKGAYTKAPVQSQYGWHVIQLDDTRNMEAPLFEEIKPQIQQSLQQQTLLKAIAELKAKATRKKK